MSSLSDLQATLRDLQEDIETWESRGEFFALAKDELKTLRSTRGDSARRSLVEGLSRSHPRDRYLWLGPAWNWLKHLVRSSGQLDGTSIFRQEMHRGQGSTITLVKKADEVHSLMKAVEPDQLVEAFLAVDNDDYIYCSVPFWLKEDWDKVGLSVVNTRPRAERVGVAFDAIRLFFAEAVKNELSVLFHANHYKSGRESLGL